MQTKKVLKMAVITLGIYFTYQSSLPLLLKFGSISIGGESKSNIDLFTIVSNLLVLIVGLILIIRPKLITKSIKYDEDETNRFIDLFAIEQIIVKIASILLIMNNVQTSIFQAATINEYLSIGNYENQIIWMKMNILIRIALAIVGIIIYWKSYSISKILFKDR
ncbi:hypothetical protein QE109_02275 [Fusibacter bizertensis]|uniref:DUF4149 domain-containing protein n=1 Tax=Fusibacter bizertensis TaxID=1488331 RepID=A0ABT6N966_9FIRM|nr:hypothetical protein [Fusibacter bizertensis]MDH8676953.1 hypothetical protein [Fusibacter bizertensis]